MKFQKVLYYIALILGLQVSLFYIFFLVADGITDLAEGKYDVIPILMMMILAAGGYVWVFFNPAKGSLVMIAGGALMAVYLFLMTGIGEWQMALIFGLPFIVPGVILRLTMNQETGFRFTKL